MRGAGCAVIDMVATVLQSHIRACHSCLSKQEKAQAGAVN